MKLHMMIVSFARWLFLPVLAGAIVLPLSAAMAQDKPLIDFAAAGVESRIAPNGKAGVEYKIADSPTGKGLQVQCTPSDNGDPGVQINPDGPAWDLSANGEIEAHVTNLSDVPLSIVLRVDNGGDWRTNPWNGNSGRIAAGKSGVVKVYFGYSWGNHGYALDPSKVVRVLVFTNKAKKDIAFRIDALKATGKPGAKPPGMVERIKPAGGVIFSAAAGAKSPATVYKAPAGFLWDLSDATQVDFSLTNPSAQPVTVQCRVDNANATAKRDSALTEATIQPGATTTVTVPFASATPWDGQQVHTSGSQLSSDHVTAVRVSTEPASSADQITVNSIRALVGPPAVLPDWLGQRPPVPGNWTKTLDDEFDGKTLNTNLWVLPKQDEASIWDHASVNSAANAFVRDGNLMIKCEKPAHPHFDDPKLQGRKYVTSVVNTFDKWAQKYGYFEARMKLPTATMGMWPAFWMMPDRGKDAGIWWKRQSTENGGMEFDIMEYLTRFGPYRYNIAMHWDGYGKKHKSIGTESIYFQPDKDGYVTSSLLWEPGKLTFYCNGKIVGVWQNDRIPNMPSYIMFTMPVGGWGTNGYVDETKLPAEFQIDYVRAWQNDQWK
jgi:beta-glucanase (GH16 family)